MASEETDRAMLAATLIDRTRAHEIEEERDRLFAKLEAAGAIARSGRTLSIASADALLAAYHDERPDPTDPTQRVAFGTSGHRGSAFDTTFNEAHIIAVAEAVRRYRASQRIDGPLFLGIDTHALSAPAGHTALEVLAAAEVVVGLALIVNVFFRRGTLDVDAPSMLRG